MKITFKTASTAAFMLAACTAEQEMFVDECAIFTPPTVVKSEGNALLQFWTVDDKDVFTSTTLPSDSSYSKYRRTIELAKADLFRPVADPPQPATEIGRRIWEDEARNVEVAYGGQAGTVRPIHCLDAWLFAYQNARYEQITHPTEFIAPILRRMEGTRQVLKIYFAAGDTEFPPREVYGFDEIRQDVAAGWKFWTVLHNHTIQTYNGAHALGVPAPSTSDVDLIRNLAIDPGLQNAWVTNGFYTVEIPANAFARYYGRSDQ